MALELIAALVAALGCAGVALALRKLTGNRLPKWAVTLAAALGLISVTIVLEYDWFPRTAAKLPEGVVIVETGSSTNALRPWTFVKPLTTSFLALDRTKLAQHPARAELKVAPLYTLARWRNPQTAAMIFDCAGLRRVYVTEGMAIGDDGQLTGAEWTTLETEDDLQKAACREG